MDIQRSYSLSVLAPDPEARDNSRVQVQSELRDFILEFRLDNTFIYRFVSTQSASERMLMIFLEIKSEEMFLQSNTTAT